MSEVGSTSCAGDLGAHHAVGGVACGGNSVGSDGGGETGPPGSGVELRVGVEEVLAADHTAVPPRVVAVPVAAGERPLGTGLLGDVVLLGGQAGS